MTLLTITLSENAFGLLKFGVFYGAIMLVGGGFQVARLFGFAMERSMSLLFGLIFWFGTLFIVAIGFGGMRLIPGLSDGAYFALFFAPLSGALLAVVYFLWRLWREDNRHANV